MTLWLKKILSPSNKKESSLLQKKEPLSESTPTAAPTLPTPKIRVVFMGTPELAASILQALVSAKYQIVLVITKPDATTGRKQEITESPVKMKATEYGIPLFQPEKFDTNAIEKLKKADPDLIIVAAYGKILPEEVLTLPKFGCINFHPSLLPKWRGASPIQNALLAGETETGVTIMLMDKGMDTGGILAQRSLSIDPNDTTLTLTEKLVSLGAELLLQTLPLFIRHTIKPVPQNNDEATLCQLIEREDGRIIWTDDAEAIYNRYRALSPWPGIFTYWKKNDDRLRLKLIRISFQKNNPQLTQPLGKVFEIGEKVGVQTTTGIIFLEEVQLEGKTTLPIDEFLRGNEGLINSFLE